MQRASDGFASNTNHLLGTKELFRSKETSRLGSMLRGNIIGMRPIGQFGGKSEHSRAKCRD
jgi:hypothetical protein